MALEFLGQVHPVYAAHEELWQRNEIRLRGDDEVLDELRQFDWEREGGEVGASRFASRKQQATYLNFPEMLATSLTGHLMKSSPPVDKSLTFGELGEVRRSEDQATPSFAELVFYNVDGVGNDGSQWPNWWTTVTKRAMATGHRWLFVDQPAGVDGVVTVEDVLNGVRPFLVEFSPLDIVNWHFVNGQLVFAVLKRAERSPLLNADGELEGNDFVDRYTLFVREGFDGLGEQFVGGGWWRFDEEFEPLLGADGQPLTGDWSSFGGEIPLWAHFYDRDPGTRTKPAMSRSAITHLGQAAIGYMNLESACEFDAWDAAMSMLFFIGVSPETFNEVTQQASGGSRWVGLRHTTVEGGVLDEGLQPIMPQIHDGSTGAVPAGVFESALDRIVENASRMAAQEATGRPESSGLSKRAGFGDIKAPRLALLASEMEQSQNTAIRWLEMAFGFERPSGVVRWQREFDLLSLSDEVGELFDLVGKAGVRSARLDARSIVLSAQERGVILDDEEAAMVEDELSAAARLRQIQEIIDSIGFVPGPAKVETIMQVLDAAGIFTDEEGNERQVRALGGGTEPTTLRDAVLEAAKTLAESRDRLDDLTGGLAPFGGRIGETGGSEPGGSGAPGEEPPAPDEE